ncbi:DUF2004 domain-containing protein [uncultured Dokdonia sp.]|uniref:DUF2004 domain-containing protein n=1 Tax=uncultured Dokdonia sp. TaxID=575653 RepID=UPI002633C0F4|nr:DUF2004 domain-containing protein [uncultured Dokdonia sp.]
MKQILIVIIMFSFFSCNKNNKSKSNNKNITESGINSESELLPYFGEITLSNARDYEIDDIKINDNNVSIDLNFEEDKINPESLKNVRNILNNIEDIEKTIKNKIREYIDQDGMVKEYYKYHIEEIDSQTISNYLKDADQNLTTELQLLSKTKLKRIGFYPDSPKFFAVFDYRVLSDFSDDILVVVLNGNGEIEKITVES